MAHRPTNAAAAPPPAAGAAGVSEAAPGVGAGQADTVAAEVSVTALSAVYDTDEMRIEALREITLNVGRSEFVCLIGQSGCGKSTLLNVMAGFVKPVSGTVRIDGKVPTDRGIRKGYVFQQYALFPWLTVAGNINLALDQAEDTRPGRAAVVDEYLKLVGLGDYGHLYPHQLSGGMQQRTAIARALAFNPHILLLDEPFAALDAFTRERLQGLVVEIWQRTRKTFVYVTHNITEAVHLAQRVVVFAARPGRIVADVPIALEYPRRESDAQFADLVRRLKEMVGS